MRKGSFLAPGRGVLGDAFRFFRWGSPRRSSPIVGLQAEHPDNLATFLRL